MGSIITFVINFMYRYGLTSNIQEQNNSLFKYKNYYEKKKLHISNR